MANADRQSGFDGRRMSRPVVIALVALVALGAITVARWVLLNLAGLIRLALLIAVVVAVAGWVIKAKSQR